MFKQKALHLADSYKLGHMSQYPEGTEQVYSNFTPRSMEHFKAPSRFKLDGIIWAGHQGMLEEFVAIWQESFFDRSWENEIKDEYLARVGPFVGPSGIAIEKVEALHKLGYLPIEVCALPEGSFVPTRVPVLTVRNTHKDFAWVTNYIETWLSAELWQMATSATTAFTYRRIMEHYARLTGAPLEFVDWQGHDFSLRGMGGMHAGARSGAGHLMVFKGSDSLPSVDYLEQYYEGKNTFVGGSVPATEHSVMCAGGADGEFALFERLITEVYPAGVVSIVSDTWDFWQVLGDYAPRLKDKILARKPDAVGLGKVVFRPDSGNPADILCGTAKVYRSRHETNLISIAGEAAYQLVDDVKSETPHGECGASDATGYFEYDGKIYQFEVSIRWNRHDKRYYYEDGYDASIPGVVTLTPEQKGAVECLWDTFGGTVTDLGYKVLHERVGLIYGEKISMEMCEEILQRLMEKGFASCNSVFGIGSFTYQYVTRDTLGFAMKATQVIIKGEPVEIFKAPKTDNGMKHSAKGLLKVVEVDGEYKLLDQQLSLGGGCLKTVLLNGSMAMQRETLDSARARVRVALDKTAVK